MMLLEAAKGSQTQPPNLGPPEGRYWEIVCARSGFFVLLCLRSHTPACTPISPVGKPPNIDVPRRGFYSRRGNGSTRSDATKAFLGDGTETLDHGGFGIGEELVPDG